MTAPPSSALPLSPEVEAAQLARSRGLGRLAAASMVGTALEWYDFMIYNTMAALIFNKLFFPAVQPMVGIVLAFSTYAVGYLSRPLGGILFGRLGDTLGRRTVLVTTLVVMGATTGSIAILPTYSSIGLASPLILLTLRLLQGAALGGEWAGAVLLVAEHGRTEKQGLNASWAQIGPAAGTLLSSAVIAAITYWVPDQAFVAWGWRVPFALSFVLVLFGLWLRLAIAETPLFLHLQEQKQVSRAPVSEVLREGKRSLLVAGAARIGPDVVYALLVVFSVTYVTQILGLPRPTVLTGLVVGAALNALATPFFGALTDKVGRRLVYAMGLVASLPWAVVFFWLADTRSTTLIVLAISVGMIFHAAMYASQGAFIIEQFQPRLRYTGSSLAYTFGSLAGGGAFAPLIMATILERTGRTGGICAYVAVALAITATALLAARKTCHGSDAS